MSTSEQDKVAAGIATAAQNAALEHTEGGVTTRQDATDLGVPMLPGSPDEPIGPEDALGGGPKRGDYSQRVGPDNYHPTMVVPKRDAEEGGPQVEVVAQRPLAAEQGDSQGKGGVSTEEAQALLRGTPRAAATRTASKPASSGSTGTASKP
jgi:hypothetical protein